MATATSSSDLRDQQPHTGPASDSTPMEPQMNGYAQQKATATEIPSPPLEQDERPNGFAISSVPSTHAPTPMTTKSEPGASEHSHLPATEVASSSSITPTPHRTDFPTTSEPSRQPATPPSPADQIMTEPESHSQPSQPTETIHTSSLNVPDAVKDISSKTTETVIPSPLPTISNIQSFVSTSQETSQPLLSAQPSAQDEMNTAKIDDEAIKVAAPDISSSHTERPLHFTPAQPSENKTAILSAKPDALEDAALSLPTRSDPSPVTPNISKHIDTSELSMSAPLGETVPLRVDAAGSEMKHEREEEDDDAPSAKRTKTQEDTEPTADFKVPDLPQTPVQAEASPSTPTEPAQANPQQPVAPIDSGPISDLQYKKLIEGIRNIKKSKSSQAFHRPVDPVALNLPNYFDVIKHPMDLGTMEQKLKDRKYASVDEYITDFNIMIGNCITFNGPQHLVSVAGLNMKAQFAQQIRKLPRSHEPMPAPPLKKRQSDVAIPREPKRRESRQSFGTAQSPVGEAFALGPNGVPLIRRDSMAADGRPKREIHRPKPKDLPYTAKPKKKKFEMELKFCDYVQTEMMRGRYKQFAYPFYDPVDPVALALPNYFKTVKKPMDMGTIGRNLKTGQYENAAEYKADVNLMFNNCYLFNPENDAVHHMGKQYEALFNDLWRSKEEWIAANLPVSERHSAEAESESEEEEEEEEEEDERVAKLSAIQEQMALLNAQAQALLNGKTTKPAAKAVVKTKTPKPGKLAPTKKGRKSSGGASSLAMRPEKKQKLSKSKVKPVTVAQKHEISQKVALLDNQMQSAALNLIVKALNDAGKHEDAQKGADGEFDIEKIPDEALHELLKMVRRHTSASQEGNDPVQSVEHRHSTSHRSSKPKKNKPMSKYEQEDRISRLKGQLESFQNPGSDSQSPELPTPGDGAETSGDESDSGSESEEE